MTHEYKAGDWVAVKLSGMSVLGDPLIETPYGQKVYLAGVACRPIPPEEQHKAERDAVIAAAKVWVDTYGYRVRGDTAPNLTVTLISAINALTAAENPPKPDFVEAFHVAHHSAFCSGHCRQRDICHRKMGHCRQAVEAGLAAVEAAKGGAK